MYRKALLVLLIALGIAACGGGDDIVIDDTPLAELLADKATVDTGVVEELVVGAITDQATDDAVEAEAAEPAVAHSGPYAEALTVLDDYRATFLATGSFVMRSNEFSTATAAINPNVPVTTGVSAYQNDHQVLVLQPMEDDSWMCGVILADGTEHVAVGDLASIDLADECLAVDTGA